jgi:hypothetical protein
MNPLFRNAQRAGAGRHLNVDLLSSYLDNQATPTERARVEEHLRTCAACQAELASLRQTVSLLHALPRVPTPRAFTLSEAAVGRVPRRTAPTVSWWGGLARVAGVAAGLVVVAVIGLTLLRSAPFMPGNQVAREAPVSQVARLTAPAAAPMATAAPAPTSAAGAAPVITSKAAKPAPTSAESANNPPPTAFVAAPPPAPTTQNDQASASQATTASTEGVTAAPPTEPAAATEAPAAAAKAAPAAEASPAGETPATGGAASAAAASAAAAPAAAANAPMLLGRGGGGGALFTPEPPPPAADITGSLPSNATLAYADAQGVWAVNAAGQRKLVNAMSTMPLVSSDRAWVSYWVMSADNPQLWVAGANASTARKLLDQRSLPTIDLQPGYGPRTLAMQDTRWIPATHALAIHTYSLPNDGNGQARSELWSLDVESSALRKVLDLSETGIFAYSPDGQLVAVLQRGNAAQPTGNLTLYHADGTSPRVALRFPADPNGYGYDTQMRWLPDSRSLWFGLPVSDSKTPGLITGITLYRVTADGSAERAGNIAALDTYWSPDGKLLAYVNPTAPTGEGADLMIANADGSNAHSYATLHFGIFAGWSPDAAYFLYQTDGHAYLGAPNATPQRVTGLADATTVRWVNARQFVYTSDQSNNVVLATQTIGGPAAALLTLPQGVTYDVVGGK